MSMHQRAGTLATQLIDSLLADRKRTLQIEAELTTSDWGDGKAAMEIEQAIYSLHKEWAAQAEQLLQRVRRLIAGGLAVTNAEAMEAAYASTLARLKFTPDKTARGMEQAGRGEFTPAEEMRNELRARLRA